MSRVKAKADKRERLVKAIEQALNKVSRENISNTPDFVLAEMLVSHLETYEEAANGVRAWGEYDKLDMMIEWSV